MKQFFKALLFLLVTFSLSSCDTDEVSKLGYRVGLIFIIFVLAFINGFISKKNER
jgi:hypothetical protein